MMNKNKVSKILNDPVYGFITLNRGILLDLIDHPYFQRLSRIKQLGLTYLVYPGAHHTRFHHAVGAAYLMKQALSTFKELGVNIQREEERGALIAILLHDIGHGPYSHALEHSFLSGVSHENVSEIFRLRPCQVIFLPPLMTYLLEEIRNYDQDRQPPASLPEQFTR